MRTLSITIPVLMLMACFVPGCGDEPGSGDAAGSVALGGAAAAQENGNPSATGGASAALGAGGLMLGTGGPSVGGSGGGATEGIGGLSTGGNSAGMGGSSTTSGGASNAQVGGAFAAEAGTHSVGGGGQSQAGTDSAGGGTPQGSGGMPQGSGGMPPGSGGMPPGSGGTTQLPGVSGGSTGLGGQLDNGGAAGAQGSAGSSGSGNSEGCPGSGTVTFSLNNSASWPSDALVRITDAMTEAVWYYNCYSDLSHTLTVNYNPGVPTAEANVDGWMTFGENPAYMVVATAMHEIGHTMGVAYSPWTELIVDGRWTGEHVNALMISLPSEQRDPDIGERDYITADAMHFWPYGLNYASEYLSEWSLINHVRVVAAMNQDKDDYRNR